jgi:hypothetical protein
MRKPRVDLTLAIGAALFSVAATLLPAGQAQALIMPHASAPAASHRSTQVRAASRRSTQVRAASPGHPAAKAARHRHVLFGGTENLVSQQRKVGHLGIVRAYFSLGEQFGGRTSDSIMGHGSTMLISLDTPVKRGPSYASIAAGKHDTEIRTFLNQVEKSAVHYRIPAVYIDFEHEANSRVHRSLGTPAQFVAAWRHIHNIAARARLNWNTGGRLHWVLVLDRMAYFTVSERPHWSLPMGFAADYFAGNSYVDGVGADGYNSGSCGQPKPRGFLQPGADMTSPGAMFNPMLAFAHKHGHMAAFISEWASIRYANPSVRPRFIHSMQEYVLDHPAIKAVSYWDSWGPGARGVGGSPHSGACNMSVNNDPRSLSALRVMNHALQGK